MVVPATAKAEPAKPAPISPAVSLTADKMKTAERTLTAVQTILKA